jgi:predicted AlkP superfamily phosphohydrolase/phosphomutase
MTRRFFFILALAASAMAVPLLGLSSCSRQSHPKVIVIGFDGLDPRLCEQMMDQGRLPTFAKLRDAGGYARLGTSIPPQSPVAWSNFITGADPGVHGIFDFVHRDPANGCEPYYSAARTINSEDGWDVGQHKLPLTFWPFNHNPTQTLLRREGIPFWDYLDAAGIPSRIYDIPSNYPPSPSHHGHMCCLSGMGVPDLMGSYSTYQYFAEDVPVPIDDDGGKERRIAFRDNVCKAVIVGPKNTMLKRAKDAKTEFEIYRHPTEPSARIELQGQTIPMKEGEWSDWYKIDFELEMPPFLPTSHAGGIVRFYLKQVRPAFQLYVSPINIDPSDPGDQKISEPGNFVSDIADELGLFYTTGFQEDHKALSNKVFNESQFHEQAKLVLGERFELMDYAFRHYKDGLLFFYFSSTDLQAHMFWWQGDDPHPVRPPELAKKLNGVIEELYVQMDGVVGDVINRHGADSTIIVLSDHGFCNFGRQFNLNTWLRDNGYLRPANQGLRAWPKRPLPQFEGPRVQRHRGPRRPRCAPG